jgi:hypothetical protein
VAEETGGTCPDDWVGTGCPGTAMESTALEGPGWPDKVVPGALTPLDGETMVPSRPRIALD